MMKTTKTDRPNVLPTRELAEEAKAVFINGDAPSQTKSLSNRKVANNAFRSVFSDVLSGATDAASVF